MNKNKFIPFVLAILGLLPALINPGHSWASSSPGPSPAQASPASPKPWHKRLALEWGGHVKFKGTVSWPDSNSYYQPVGTGPYYDGLAEFRLKNKIFLGKWGHLETHYEAVYSGGDTRRKQNELKQRASVLFGGALNLPGPINDERRLMDLTGTIEDENDHILYHRLDRFYLTMQPKWGAIRIGRQAVTWGNGQLFNPMDLFNPFAPTDISRDYKVGDDMLLVQFSTESVSDFQILYVPRRDPISRDVEWARSSLAGKTGRRSDPGSAGPEICASQLYFARAGLRPLNEGLTNIITFSIAVTRAGGPAGV